MTHDRTPTARLDIADKAGPMPRTPTYLAVSEVSTPIRELYFCVQRIALEDDLRKYMATYFRLLETLLARSPRMRGGLVSASLHVLAGDYDAALIDIGSLVVADDEVPTTWSPSWQ
ncbi:flagellar biosynthesis repressor FlbT [Rhodopseudomonas sp.]|uniref:flagellar biosynthesis repressor FlbT n=1 Tax=Rhodopseudomonas sp. TaxID=1078 RepID=UPI0039E5275F